MRVSTPATQALTCPQCGSSYRAEDLDAARGVLTCRYCRSLTLFRGTPASDPVQRPRPAVELPRRFTVEDGLQGLVIRRRWFQPSFVFLAGFCVIWNGFLFAWYSFAGPEAPLLVLVFPALHVALGLGLTYFTLAGFLNTTTIQVGADSIQVRHAPLPWPGVAHIPAMRVTQLFCKERIHRGKNGSRSTYEVWAVLDDGPTKKLVSGLDEPDQALFVEQRVEKALGLADRPMPGELPR